MKKETIFPAGNIAFYEDNYIGDALLGPKESRAADSAFGGNEGIGNFEKNIVIDIFDHGPWQYPAQDIALCARYVIGQSRYGYHWRTEFIWNRTHGSASETDTLPEQPKQLESDRWSPANTTVNEAIKRARRCIAIQTMNLDLDTKTKIKLRFANGREKYFNIDQVPMDVDLIYRVSKDDLHRLALFNGYLSWREFEQGILDLNFA